MSSSITPQLQGTESPSQIEFLWEKHRTKLNLLLWIILGAVGAYYGWKYLEQSKVNAEWSRFCASTSLESTYVQQKGETQNQFLSFFEFEKLPQYVREKDLAALEKGLAEASPQQKPYLLLVLARKAASEKKWDEALKALSDLESGFPGHSLVVTTDYPVQAREEKKDPDPKKDASPKKPKEPELVDAKKGSIVTLMRAQIERMKTYSSPAHFQQDAIPADSPKVKVELSGQGSFVIALLKDKAPGHTQKFLELVRDKHWENMSIDEINRPGKQRYGIELFRFHVGFPTSRSDKKDEWKVEPSKALLDFENPEGSHFAGAVFGRGQADGKSCADMFWVQANDNPTSDGNDVIFGFVVEGLDVVKRVCELSFGTSQEEDSGRGKPSERIQITSVTAL